MATNAPGRPRGRLSGSLLGLFALLCVLAALLWPRPSETAEQMPRVVLVRGDYLGENGLVNQPKSNAAYEAAAGLLRQLRVPFVASSDSAIETGGLPAAAVAIFPYNRAMTDREARRVQEFVAGGGKVIVCFVGHRWVLQSLGLEHAGFATPAADQRRVSFTRELPGVNRSLASATDCVARVTPLDGAEVMGTWGTGSEAPAAVTRGPAGVYLGMVPESTVGHSALWRALLGELAPALWPQMVVTDPAQISSRGPYATLADLARAVQAVPVDTPGMPPAHESINTALTKLAEARQALQDGRVGPGLALVREGHAAANLAYWQSYPPVPGELRGVWMCNYAEPSWSVALSDLAKGNMNAVFPYMMSGGVAFYRSQVLAVHPVVDKQGDCLKEAMAAARATGIPLHARMLNLTTLFAPASAKEELARQGRLMRDTRGKTVDWLCPTNLANRAAQVASALEMLRYGAAGVHFDYLRYPSQNTCFCATCRSKFERDLGVAVKQWPEEVTRGGYRGRYADWRREQLTSLVAEISSAVRREYPGAAVSAAVFLNWEDHRETFGQDWKAWTDRGLVDFVCPMNYTTTMERFTRYVSRQEKWLAGSRVPYASGIGLHADGYHFQGPEQMLEQIRVAREHGSQGFVVFNYSRTLVEDYLPWLSLGVTREPTEFQFRAPGGQ